MSAAVHYPLNAKGERKSTETNKKVFAAAAEVVDKQLAAEILAEKNWRFKYDSYVVRYVRACLKSEQASVESAQAGLDEIYKLFCAVGEGTSESVEEALQRGKADTFFTGTFKGSGKKESLRVPYKGGALKGSQLKAQALEWCAKGTIEVSTAQAIGDVVDHSDWADLSDLTFVLLGAGAAMGPFSTLMELGANVVAIDIDRSGVWERLLNKAESCTGTFTFPMKVKQTPGMTKAAIAENAGCNIITQAPDIAAWVAELFPKTRLILGSYVYLTGDMFPRVSVACDMILRKVLEKRKDAALAMLGTPTDCYVVPPEAHRDAEKRYATINASTAGLVALRTALAPVTRDQLRSNAIVKAGVSTQGEEFPLCNAIIVQQGPNYILSKRMQQWRCIVARSQGHVVSFNVAPSTRTVSVTQNRLFAWGYHGMEAAFPCVEIFEPATSNSIMTVLLINDLRNEKSAASPAVHLRNPHEMFTYAAFHGGFWRMPYRLSSTGHISVLVYLWSQVRIFVIIALALLFIYLKFF